MKQENNIPFCYQYKRNYINEKIREMAVSYGVAFKDAYNTLYAEFTKQSGSDIHVLYRLQEGTSKMDTLQMLEPEHGFLTKFYKIIQHEYSEFRKQS